MMDHLSCRDREFDIDLESGIAASEQTLNKDSVSNVKIHAKALLSKVCGRPVDGESRGDNELSTSGSALDSNGVPVENLEVGADKMRGSENMNTEEEKLMKDKRKKTNNKKHPKPPRPPKGPSLDVADQKLIREIAQLAMIKRAKNERRKALRKMKADGTSSSVGNILAVAFTVLFFLVIIFQGMSSSSSTASFQGSPTSVAPADMGLISVQYYPNPSASVTDEHGNDSPTLIEHVAALDNSAELRRDG